ncbi:MAG: CheR family methyltransferase [Christensenellales bacterium]|jgi:chemotaxis protein methyltransferase CheR
MFQVTEQDFKQFADYVRAHYGINFKKEKKTLVEGRLRSLLTGKDFRSLSDYLEYVKADKTGQAASEMLNRITTNHTFFMREPAHFHYFRDTVLPYLVDNMRYKDLRIWSAACSSGEEPYTLAMLMADYLGPKRHGMDTKILATDISQKVLDAAKTGVYSADKLTDVPLDWKKRYFSDDGAGNYVLSDEIRNEVIFRRLNLMEPFPFRKKMHVIFCRNVMIYFDTETKERLVERLYEITEPGGFLFIGHSEGLNREKTQYRYVMPAVYRKD